ncbi:SAM-dependent methyltransferase [Streptomyces sp. NPDC001840]
MIREERVGERAFYVVPGGLPDPYRGRVEETYADSAELWQRAIGTDLWFQFGVYDSDGPSERSLDDAGRAYFEEQLGLAGVSPNSAPMDRILDIGFGWGTALEHLARMFPACRRLDGVNISSAQVHYAARRIAELGLSDRVRLYLCNAQDIGELPDADQPYDLVISRGSITHFSYDVLESTMRALVPRVRPGGTVVISESLYNVPLNTYASAVADEADRLACGHRKTPGYLTEVLDRHGLMVRDLRELPSNGEVIRWLDEVRANIGGLAPEQVTKALDELRVTCESWGAALRTDKASVFSVIARRSAGGGQT